MTFAVGGGRSFAEYLLSFVTGFENEGKGKMKATEVTQLQQMEEDRAPSVRVSPW